MRKFRFFRALVATLWGLVASVAVAEESQWKLNSSREIYQGQLDQIDKEHGEQISSLLAKYRNALVGLKGIAQKQGDLQGVLDANTELERLDADKTPPTEAAFSSQEKLREKQTICAHTAREAELAKSRKIVEVVDEYRKHLEEEKKRLTIAGKFDAAKSYADEIERVKGGERESAAALMVKSAAKADAGPSAPPNAPTQTAASGCKIHETAPPPIEGANLKPLALQGTRFAGRISQVIATAQLGAIDNMVAERRRSDYTHSKTESGEIQLILRLALRTQTRDQMIQSPLVLVQYFAKDVAARGIVKPKQIDAHPVWLPAVSGKEMSIDFPSVGVEKYEYRSYSSNYTSKSGHEFLGLMVTVFGKDQDVVYQAVTHHSLMDLGESALAESKLAKGRSEVMVARSEFERARDAYNAGMGGDNRDELLRRYHEARMRYDELRRRQEK